MTHTSEARCSFCGIEQSRTEKIFLGPGVGICDVCVESCQGPFDDDLRQRLLLEPEKFSQAIEENLSWGPLNRGAAIRANFSCEYCDRRFLRTLDDYYSWQIDHIIPSGEDSLDNYALACQTCNHLKRNYLPSGDTRDERIADARREISKRRSHKLAELARLRDALGLPQLII